MLYLQVSVMLEESLGGMISDEGMSLTNMDVIRSQKLWSEILNQKSSNREVFNKSIEKSSQFTEKMFCDRNLFYTIDPSLEV
ncbi:hypothetical protein Smp_133730 [Schistosoma mansoni]|uniref:hypothetical protein n=1 Tax=Schistosoma mansoni TaxID=6183 RepID=UPI00022DCAB2|nr:hypothetical protein Smp_133730 [Schistosoma mansoni]|eukprot:XP_018654546.1 hypothetical protein Smp_133730 [Schistosoma mansoni]